MAINSYITIRVPLANFLEPPPAVEWEEVDRTFELKPLTKIRVAFSVCEITKSSRKQIESKELSAEDGWQRAAKDISLLHLRSGAIQKPPRLGGGGGWGGAGGARRKQDMGEIAHPLNLTLRRPAPYDFPHNIRHWIEEAARETEAEPRGKAPPRSRRQSPQAGYKQSNDCNSKSLFRSNSEGGCGETL